MLRSTRHPSQTYSAMANKDDICLSSSEEKLEEIQEGVTKSYDFIRFTMADMNGVTKGPLLPAELAAKVLKSGIGIYSGIHMSAEYVTPEEVEDCHYGNVQVIPDIGTLHPVPWVKKYRVGQCMAETFWNTSTPQEACTRNMAQRMLNKLDDMGLMLYSGNELEFFLLKQDSDELVFKQSCYMSSLKQSEYESWFYDVATNVRKAGVCVGPMHIEARPGQFEFSTQPKIGIDAADDALILKQAIKEMAILRGWQANFMAVPFKKSDINAGHFNFSVWHKESGENALWDKTAEDTISEFGRHWIAGMIHHAKALTALSNITTNCYRTRHFPIVPSQANWGIDNRLVMIRVKNDGSEGTYIENRLPSGPFNPYLVMAATIAAGIDGVLKKLTCPDSANDSESNSTKKSDSDSESKAEKLPSSLKEALKYLEEDDVMVEALGETFVKWFVKDKTEVDLAVIKGVIDDGDLIDIERYQYGYKM